MSVEVVYGEPRNRPLALKLVDALREIVSGGTIYLGYPVLATADARVFVDALLVSSEHGPVAFQIAEGLPTSDDEWDAVVEQQDQLYSVLESHLGRHDSLRRGRKLAFAIQTVTVFASDVAAPSDVDGFYVGLGSVPALVQEFRPIDDTLVRALQAALQRVSTIKPVKRRARVQESDSRGAKLKFIERGIANLDRWQKQAAIETPEGPQRIRGLAGSGKTIVLALKAAYLHAQHPDWRVALCFQSRALYQQLEDLVVRFTFEHANDKPDFERLQLLHAWGAADRDGFYKSVVRAVDATFRDFSYGAATHGREGAFRGVCRELLDITSQGEVEPLFDAVLIDEAQDLPAEFFRLVYRFTRDPKRIVWAYDELQNLSEAAMPTTDELFGTQNDESVVSLQQGENEARRDIILPVCYRNSPWALTTAHALGFGIYRPEGPVQHFDDASLWSEIGYSVLAGSLDPGHQVELERSRNSYPDYFPELLDPDDAVTIRTFGSEEEQDAWVAERIKENLLKDELEHDDILIVLPDAYTSKRRASRLIQSLNRVRIEAHLVGVGSSVDEVFIKESVAVAHIYRAKGNEAPMVYVMDAQYAARTPNAVTRRNIVFTAVTRSRAWVRICGYGDDMSAIEREVEEVRERNFRLAFKIPTVQELEQLRRIHRERSESEVAAIRRAERSLKEVLEAFERDELDIQDLPPRLRTQLMSLIREDLLDEPDR